ncbi:MAG TPA: hypothetical protein VFR67_27205 [Pilimelia sp.]|nr:hypothetical protein [Pilimelia sp.]
MTEPVGPAQAGSGDAATRTGSGDAATRARSGDAPTRAADPGEVTWRDYVAAAQRLDAVRRGAANLAAEQDRVRTAAHEELVAARARLAPQRARLRELGVPDDRLTPTPAEGAAAAQAVGADPAAVLTALRHARMTADAADATVVSGRGFVPVGAPGAPAGTPGAGGAPPWLRNLVVYGPFALAVLVVQLALYLTADESSLFGAAALCSLTMPAAAFGLGWLVTGMVFPPGPSGKPERTPLVGAVVCFAPVLLTCVGVGILALAR